MQGDIYVFRRGDKVETYLDEMPAPELAYAAEQIIALYSDGTVRVIKNIGRTPLGTPSRVPAMTSDVERDEGLRRAIAKTFAPIVDSTENADRVSWRTYAAAALAGIEASLDADSDPEMVTANAARRADHLLELERARFDRDE